MKMNSVKQKRRLLQLLQKRFGPVKTEYVFDWLTVPHFSSMVGDLASIVDALSAHRGYTDFYNSGRRLQCDYYIPLHDVIVEYDERQHFTIPRDISLSLYPDDVKFGFNLTSWRETCQRVQARDNDPPYRDEQRAFYDSLRDILAHRNGYQVVRIRHGDFDWESEEASLEVEKFWPMGIRID